ncbi:acetyltransferase (GNAT) domain protein [Leptospira yanagawae serovar Saopaulo str. Sao Paulo = ATCC 700523]|uniref:Acetyltransferase (GNAT) domain protein n=1 Tax=Leptospira yanagawae serovar Saopaulo str. Sao Paulo = ATCC 700523 TaxID=1249483 RepID=A0A5E8HG65_9LEPT|nr:GNAT family N-acetyltransferase [Leptospira yanagawae]EOQ90265.1 acetyltransferase (GNAT) domain protein [Leptospira yanagawae serovar Saopaulo str. Sao Paulo = ATCC 700523]
MESIEYKVLLSDDDALMAIVAEWYMEEWRIPFEKTIAKLKAVTADPSQFQLVLFENSIPVGTGGVYHHVGLLEQQPKFKIHKHWLALVYTKPRIRKNGFGSKLCGYLEKMAKERGILELHLFSDTAVSLYERLGWSKVEVVGYGSRNVTVMKKNL